MRHSLLLVLIPLLHGCVAINTSLYPGQDIYHPIPSEDVQIFQDWPPEGTYEVIGELSIGESFDNFENDFLLRRRLKKQVAREGADAVVVQQLGTGTQLSAGNVALSAHRVHGFLIKYSANKEYVYL